LDHELSEGSSIFVAGFTAEQFCDITGFDWECQMFGNAAVRFFGQSFRSADK